MARQDKTIRSKHTLSNTRQYDTGQHKNKKSKDNTIQSQTRQDNTIQPNTT